MSIVFDHNLGLTIKSVGIVTSLTCNLQCYGCNVGSNFIVNDNFSIRNKFLWIQNLANVLKKYDLHLNDFHILGGEPFINDDVLKIYYEVKNNFPNSEIIIHTNGLLLKKNEHLIEALRGEPVKITVTVHDSRPEILKKITAGLYVLKNNNINFSFRGDYSPLLKNKLPNYWWRIDPLNKGNKLYPHKNENGYRSWAVCTLKDCVNLYRNSLYKCDRLAYLPNTLAKTGQLSDPDWQLQLNYKPLNLDNCTYEDVIKFFSAGPEDVCASCPSREHFFDSKPIYRKEYENFKFDANFKSLGTDKI